MAYKAIHLRRGSQNIYITIDKLFEVAFGPTPRDYRLKSLMGWRPLVQNSESSAFGDKEGPSIEPDPSSCSSPGVIVYETEALIVVEVELPPIQEDSLYIEISGDLLIIRGRQATASPSKRVKAGIRRPKIVHRYVQLPVIAKPGEVRARLEGNTVRVIILKQDKRD